MRRLGVRLRPLGRGVAIGVVVSGAVWVGQAVIARPHAANATIVRDLSRALGLSRVRASSVASSGWRRSLVNGEPVFYRVDRAQVGFSVALERFAQRAGAEPAPAATAPTIVYRAEWEQWGCLLLAAPQGTLVGLGMPAEPDVGTPHLLAVVGMNDLAGAGSTLMTILLDANAGVEALAPPRSGDAAGQDVENVPRFPGAVRQVSVDDLDGSGQVAVYRSGASPTRIRDYYRGRLPGLGWEPLAPDHVAARRAGATPDALFFSRGPQTLAIAADRARSGEQSSIVVSLVGTI